MRTGQRVYLKHGDADGTVTRSDGRTFQVTYDAPPDRRSGTPRLSRYTYPVYLRENFALGNRPPENT
jgi:hypothetical protein